MNFFSFKTLAFSIFSFILIALSGCSSQPTSYDISRGINYVKTSQPTLETETSSFIAARNAINQSGCTLFTLQKVYWGLPQDASKQDVALAQQYLSSKVNAIHGLPDNASQEQLYNVVYNKLFKTGLCKNLI